LPAHDALLGALIDARTSCGMTQTALASALGKPQSFVAKVEAGERRLDVVEFMAIADAIGVDRLELFAIVSSRSNPPLAI
jgi:transcriptional regulator with XRE-family HTH domain